MTKNYKNLDIKITTKDKLPRLPFLNMKKAVLGKAYNLSIVFTNNKTTKKLNLAYRGKNKPANILSFPLSKNHGEIFLSIKEIEKSSKIFNRKGSALVGLFLVHAMVHLKGHFHGSTMERIEERIQKAFRI